MLVESIGRGPNGKADYPALRQRVGDWVAQGSTLAPAASPAGQGD